MKSQKKFFIFNKPTIQLKKKKVEIIIVDNKFNIKYNISNVDPKSKISRLDGIQSKVKCVFVVLMKFYLMEFF